ncbi:MAG: hypothetical protein ACXVCY_04420 [Pseudobdellovibrionaceae bacterium]
MLSTVKNIFKSFLPQNRPVIPFETLKKIAKDNGVNIEKEICVIGIRGFFNPGVNQRAIYDDAICIVTPVLSKTFNANTDPGAFRKGIANLTAGVWLYKLGIHGLSKPKILQYEALVQADRVVVKRDQMGLDNGWFGINIHHGGYSKVSSLGCQTIHPRQWDEFISAVKSNLKFYNQTKVKYILKEMNDEKLA